MYPLLASVLWDESEWESPHTFNPAHFLDMDGKFIKRDAFMVFSAGQQAQLSFLSMPTEPFPFTQSLLCYRSQGVCGRKSGSDGTLPLLHLPAPALSFHSSTWSDRG